MIKEITSCLANDLRLSTDKFKNDMDNKDNIDSLSVCSSLRGSRVW